MKCPDVTLFQAEDCGEKGKGVVTTREVRKGEALLEYVGKSLSNKQYNEMESIYEEEGKMSYILGFKYNERKIW